MEKINVLTKTTKLNQLLVEQYLNKQAVALDATIGNGNDTLFLCQNCQFVYGFDIQDVAINNTDQLLENNNYHNYQLIKDNYINFDKYIPVKLDIIMFNLGYLPQGDKKITTNYQDTLMALNKALDYLNVNGLISIVIYWGHEEGKIEKEKIIQFAKNLDKALYHVAYTSFLNQRACPPEILLITKKK